MAQGKVFVIADTHFGDEAIFLYEDRPFRSVADADEEMVARWNETVSEEDTVFHLGDFASLSEERCRELLRILHGHKRLVMGNHDRHLTPDEWRRLGFEECYDMPVIYQNWFILSHEPLYISRRMPYANIFGHIHGMPLYRTTGPQSACVSVERTDYRPVLFEDLKRKIKQEAEQAAGQAQ